MLRNAARPGDIANAVRGDSGFSTLLHLSTEELADIRGAIEAQWLAVLCEHAPDRVDGFRDLGIARYHEFADGLPHESMWPKSARILPAEVGARIRSMEFMRELAEAFGAFTVSDEDEVGWPEIYWRLVRPDRSGDMGPLHADRWFWDLGHGTTPAGVERVKVWVAVVTEPGRSGLRVVPASHRREWRFHGEARDGKLKPQIDEDEETLGARLIDTEPGDAVVFHDALLHGGAANRGAFTRVSFEFTMFVPASRG